MNYSNTSQRPSRQIILTRKMPLTDPLMGQSTTPPKYVPQSIWRLPCLYRTEQPERMARDGNHSVTQESTWICWMMYLFHSWNSYSTYEFFLHPIHPTTTILTSGRVSFPHHSNNITNIYTRTNQIFKIEAGVNCKRILTFYDSLANIYSASWS